MEDIRKRIEAIEKEMRDTPYHKGTEGYIGLMRARLAKLKDQLLDSGKKGGGGGGGFSVKKHGHATVVLVGFPSVGKSTLLNALTNAQSPTAEYAFTTVTVIPGMMKYKGASIQILDVPGLIEGAAEGKGRGREVLSVVRSADLLLIIAPSGHEEDFEKIETELYSNGVRLNVTKPDVTIKKSGYGGMRVNSSVKQELEKDTIEGILKEYRLINAEINIKEKLTIDRLVDAFATNRVFVPSQRLISKIDLNPNQQIPEGTVGISAAKNIGKEKLKEAVWDKLGLTRVYLRRPDGTVDTEDPIIVYKKDTLERVMYKIGNDFAENKKSAKIWGPGAKFPGQTVSLSTPVVDEMEVMFV